MTIRPIPPRPSLEFDRKQAKALLDALRAGDPAALARFRASHPRFRDAAPGGRGLEQAALHDAQLVIAREYGSASWPRWKQFVEARMLDSAGRAAALIRAAFTGDMCKATALLDAEPTLAEHDLYTACVTGAAARVARLLAGEPALVRRRGGPLDHEPLLYACCSRFLRVDRARATGIVEAVRLLLQHGADPNVFYVLEEEDGGRWQQFPIYGAAGIANNPELTGLLLAAGADVNEGKPEPPPGAVARALGSEDLYHATEFADTTCLRLLLDAHPHRGRVSYALARMLDFENPEGVALLLRHGADPNLRVEWMHDRTHLHRAIAYGRTLPIIRMLVEAGGDPNAADDVGETPLGYAVRQGRDDAAALLRAAGGDDARVTDAERVAGARARGDRATPGGPIDPDLLCNAACRNDAAEIRRLVAAGADPSAPGGLDGTAPIHWAAWRGQYEATKALVEAGADIHTLNRYDSDALDMAMHGSQHCHDPFGGMAMKLPEEITHGDYPAVAELLIAAGSRPRKRMLFGSDAVKEVLRRYGVPDAE